LADSELILSTERRKHGHRAITPENRFLRIVVLPEVGGRIWQITFKPLDANLRWNNPAIAPAGHPLNSSYDDLWTGNWHAEPFTQSDEARIEFQHRFTNPNP
jgi:hypothetical protein